MSFTLKMADNRGMRMQGRIEELEKALLRIGHAKKQLGRNTAEAKSRIQCNISRQLETLRNREVWLLNQLDTISGVKEEVLQQQSAKSRIQCNISRQLETLRNREVWLLNQLDTISGVKEEVLQQQSVRLNKTLGVLQSSMKYPDGNEDEVRSFDRMDLGDLQPEESPHVSFKSDPNSLRDAIMNYGRIDANGVNGLQSPFMDPDHQAPSLPRHFEDYNDAEHHILYKTVEELSRNKGNPPPHKSMGLQSSYRLEDWLMPVTKTTPTDTTTSQCHIALPKLSNNLSDWLRSPVFLKKDPSPPINDMSKDASIQTWLHKIKQCPMEEEDDYEFIEESETQTQSSGLEQFPDPDEEDTEIWLYRKDLQSTRLQTCNKQNFTVPEDGWLLKTNSTYVREGDAVDMSRYFAKITDELDKWLIRGGDKREQKDGGEMESLRSMKPIVPSSLDLSKTFRSHVSRADNPWLLRSSVRSNSFSPVSSRSSISTVSTTQKTHCKWLLNGGLDELPATTQLSCPIMDKFKKNAESLQWVKSGQKSIVEKSDSPMSTFLKMAADQSLWLKSASTDKSRVDNEVDLPMKKIQCDNMENWLHKSSKSEQNTAGPLSTANFLSKGDNKGMWLFASQLSAPKYEDDLEEIDL